MEQTIAACSGAAFPLRAGEALEITDTQGQQVVDFFAVCRDNLEEILSPGVTIDVNESLRLGKGDTLYTSRYRAMFEILEDDVQVHDLLHPCCRPEMYDFLYQNGQGHANCFDTIHAELRALGLPPQPLLHPVNLFMHTRIHTDGSISVEAPLSKAGERIVLRALLDVHVVLAACSVSESACNGGRCTGIRVRTLPDR